MHRTTAHRLGIASVAAILLAACSPAGGISVKDAWVRITDPAAPAAAYLVITNTSSTADSLTAAATAAYGAAELHETVAMEPSAAPMGSMDSMASASPGGDMMGMQPVSEITVPGNGSVELKPGGYHIMLMNPTGTLKIGDTVELTLTFKNAGQLKVTAEVRGA